jgi:hypothetical protein
MQGLAKIAIDYDLGRQIELAYEPHGYEEITNNNKKELAGQVGTIGGLIGGIAGHALSEGNVKKSLLGAGIGGLAGATLGYGSGYEYSSKYPKFTPEQELKQLELLETHPIEVDNYLTRNANTEDTFSLVKLAADSDQPQTNKQVYRYLKKNYPDDCLQWAKMVNWKLKRNVPLEKVKMGRRPGGAREKDKVKRIVEAIKEGQSMEPVVLVRIPDGTYKIADGYHRTLGFKHADKRTINAWVAPVPIKEGPWDREMHEKKLNVGK